MIRGLHILIVLSLTVSTSWSQFSGGPQVGGSTAELVQDICAPQSSGGMFEGGMTTGTAGGELLQSNCSIQPFTQLFGGGGNSGAAYGLLIVQDCSVSGYEEPYRGGAEDGAAVAGLFQQECVVDLQLHPFNGGVNDGTSSAGLVQVECPLPLTEDIFTGGHHDGSEQAMLTQSECVQSAVTDIWSGGALDGHAKGINEQTICLNTTPLPIELVAWEAQCVSGHVILSWSTATEVNNAEFIIERSHDHDDWEALLTVEAAGQSSSMLHYEALDEDPVNSLAYYRLAQIDLDGTRTVFRSIPVECRTSELGLLAYPNPTRGQLHVELRGPGTILEVELLSSAGNRVYHGSAQGERLELDLSGLPAGMYIVVVHTAEDVLQERVVVEP
ncbi:MAG: T9SS type A sorting domain-containing protein [Flavobacteriales bacterium]|jgi:hypothetical protein|nr:T9SS type A sorting domain-containing protein [Flavobacteriales bacterium]